MANASVVASKTADHRVMCAGQIGTVTLGIICKENAMSLYFSTGCVLGDTGEEKAISVQVDDESPREQTFVIPNRKLVFHLADHRDAIEFVKPMLGRDQMKVRIAPPSHPPFTATFAVAGLDKAILPLRDACGW
jgi:type VI secretion system protein VasI